MESLDLEVKDHPVSKTVTDFASALAGVFSGCFPCSSVRASHVSGDRDESSVPGTVHFTDLAASPHGMKRTPEEEKAIKRERGIARPEGVHGDVTHIDHRVTPTGERYTYVNHTTARQALPMQAVSFK